MNETAVLIVAFTLWIVIDNCFFVNPDMPFLKARQRFSFPLGMVIAKNKDRIENFISGKKTHILVIEGDNGYPCNDCNAAICG